MHWGISAVSTPLQYAAQAYEAVTDVFVLVNGMNFGDPQQ